MKELNNSTNFGSELKTSIKKNIARAWYKLDQPSYERWLEGRKFKKGEMNY